MTGRLLVALALAGLTACGFLYFPGHTFLQSDTQIYMPILERFWDSSLYPKDPVALRPHVSYTIYDETAILLRKVTGQDFQTVLAAQQILYRFAGLAGVVLIGRALSLSWVLSLLLASVYGLGATIGGPAVLVFEYEPVPRGYAGPLLMFSIGLALNHRWLWAGLACGLAILYHPPTAFPIVVLLGISLLFPSGRADRIRGAAAVAACVALALLMSRIQIGHTERQILFGWIDPELEKLQRLRGAYNWLSIWNPVSMRQTIFSGIVALAAYLRLRPRLDSRLRFALGGMALFGAFSIFLSWALQETLKWSMMSQFQPARATMFLTIGAVLMCAINGMFAARDGHWWQAWPWWMVAFGFSLQHDLMTLLVPDPRDPTSRNRFLLMAALGALAAGAAWFDRSRPRIALALAAIAMLIPFSAAPGFAKVRNYPALDHPEIHEVADWARANTPKDAVFLFPTAARSLHPGLFRVYSLRGLYVDWKSGGQVNLLKDFATEWWQRWETTMAAKPDPPPFARYRELGIDYVIFEAKTRPAGATPVYENALYAVYPTDADQPASR